MDIKPNGTTRSAAATEKPPLKRRHSHDGTAAVATKPPDEQEHGNIVNAEEESLTFWVAKISKSIVNIAGWSVQVGRELLAAKDKLGYGKWTKLFEPGGLRITLRTAETLMAIGSHPYFKESKNFANLPPSYTALYALSHLDEKVIERGVKEGVIGPGMKISEAKRFVVANQHPPATPAEPLAFNTEKRLERIKRFLKKELEAWPVEQHSFLADYLEAEAKEIRSIPIGDEQSTEGKI